MDPNDVVADRFEILRLAGWGGMGSVYAATDRRSGKPVAVKTLRGEADAEAIERFVLESQVLAQLSHPGIVRYVSHGRVGDELFLAMEWLDGISLAERLAKKGLTIEESITVVRRVAEALGVAHKRGIVHRDIKPANIFLVDGDLNNVRLLDFGIARLRSSSSQVTQTGVMVGTPGYMSPEQARGEKDIDARADVFSLGCVLFKCLTGKNAFSGGDIMAVLVKVLLEQAPRASEIQQSVPPAVDDLVAHMLAKRPGDRPADANAVVAEIESLGPIGSSDASPAKDAPSLTTDERRMMCVLLARTPIDANGAPKGRDEEALRGAVAPHGGRLDFLADGSLLVTLERKGTPADNAARGARCALAMRALLSDLSIALVAGEGVLLGRVPMGPVIDRGASLLALADPRGPVRLDEVMVGFLHGRFDVRVEGEVCTLFGERDGASTTRTLLGKPSTCVGRERELSTLEGIWRECLDEPIARVVLVTAPAGVGKSRVRDELLRKVAAQGPEGKGSAQVWTSRGDPMSAGSPFGMIAEPIRRAAGIRPGQPLSERQLKLYTCVVRSVPPANAPRVTEFLGEIIGTPFSDSGSLELRAARNDPQLMGDQMRRAWEDWLDAESSKRPILLVLEDLHWGDLPSITFVDAAVRRLSTRAFMVLALARPEVHTLFPDLWAERSVTQLRLAPLTRKACARLVREVLGDQVDEATIDRVVERADGNAFFLEELIRAVAEGKGDELPSTVLAMVQARLEGLDVEARRVLRAASVFGKVFSSTGVMALVGGDDGPTLKHNWFDDLIAKEVIVRPAEARFRGEYAFTHALIREAAYSMLTEADRALGHRLAAEWLERTDTGDAVVLAEHFERAGEPLRAITWYRRAAEQALEGNDLIAAIQRVERAIACGAQGEIEGELRLIDSEARSWRGESELSQASAIAAMRLLPRGSRAWCNAASELAAASGGLGSTHHLVALVSELSSVEPDGNESELVTALSRVARPLFWAGKHALASRVLARAGALEKRSRDLQPTALASLHVARGLEARIFGDPGECVKCNELAVAASERAGNLRIGCNQRGNLGYTYLEIGAYPEAERTLREALATAERLRLPSVVAIAQQNLGLALARRGALDEAVALERASHATFEAQNDFRRAGASLIYLVAIELARGTLEDADRSARRAVEMLANMPPMRCCALAALATVALARGEIARAVEAAREAHDLLTTLGAIDEGESAIRLAHAEALHASGDIEGARIAITRAHDRLLERAAKIRDETWRTTFLGAIPENARTVARALEWNT